MIGTLKATNESQKREQVFREVGFLWQSLQTSQRLLIQNDVFIENH